MPDRWGGRKNRDAPTCATCGLLAFIVACSADAASCFDRVRSAHASALCTKKRMTKSFCKCASQVVRNLHHYVKTDAGVSANFYRQEDGDVELTGIPQGTARIMDVHTMVSDTMLAPMNALAEKDASYFVMTSADGSKTAHRTVDMYVDDATMYVGYGSHEESFPCISDATDDDSMQQHDTPLHESCFEAAGRMGNAVLQWTRLKYICSLPGPRNQIQQVWLQNAHVEEC